MKIKCKLLLIAAVFLSGCEPEESKIIAPKLVLADPSKNADNLLANNSDENLLKSRHMIDEYLVIRGTVDSATLVANFAPFNILSSDVAFPAPIEGDYTLELLDASNNVMQQIPFALTFGSEGRSSLGFFIVSALYSADVKSAQIVFNNQVLAKEIASDNAPQVTITFPNGGESLKSDIITFEWTSADLDGDDLTYIVQYSVDGGNKFETLAIDWTETTFDIPIASLRETSQGKIRIVASDGFNSSVDESDGLFITPNNAPNVSIQNPVNNTTFSGVEPIFFDARAFDLEDGQLIGSNLVWASSLDGIIGNGKSFNLIGTDLQEGNHVIMLTSTDNSGESASANIIISYLANTN